VQGNYKEKGQKEGGKFKKKLCNIIRMGIILIQHSTGY